MDAEVSAFAMLSIVKEFRHMHQSAHARSLARSLARSHARSTARSPARSLIWGSIFIAAAMLLAGCAQTAGITATSSTSAGKGGKGQPMASQFPDIPIPKGVRRNVDKTVVVGTRIWYGQLTLTTLTHSADTMFDFYSRELPNYGWRKLATVRAPTSILSYDRENRILTIAIQASRIAGSEITITVSPREEPQSGAPTGAPAGALIHPAPVSPAPQRPPPVRRNP